MGVSDERRGARQTGAPTLTLTRRQQKRARKHQHQQNQRRTAPPAARQTATTTTTAQQKAQRAKAQRPKAQQTVVVETAATVARDATPAAANAARPVRLQQRRENAAPEPRRTKRHEKPETADQPETRRDDSKRPPALRAIRRDVAEAGTREKPRDGKPRDETKPATGLLKVAKRTRPMPSVRPAQAADSPSTSGRRYPTLARMTAVKQKLGMADRGQVLEPGDPLPWETRERQEAEPPSRRWAASSDTALASSADEQMREPTATVARPSRQPVPTRRLRDEREHGRPAPQPTHDEAKATIRAPRFARPAPLPRAELATQVAVIHAGIAAAAALIGAGMLVLGVPGALWSLNLMVIAGAGGWLAYALEQRGDTHRMAGVILLVSQLAALGWLLALLGPRAALLAAVPALALLALRTSGQGAAIGAGAAAVVLYAGFSVLTLEGMLAPPGATLDAGAQALVDGMAVAAGLGATLYGALRVARNGNRMEAAAQARLHEARLLRARLVQLQQQVEDDGERLDAGLARALHGNGIPPVAADGALSPLAETVNATAERLQTLQRDREDRVRLEGAVHATTRAVERAWLGLPWSWPEWSGTAMDELVALLRTPRPREAQESWSEETPTLLQLPTLDRAMTPRPWESETGPVYPYVAKAVNGWSRPLGWPQTAGRMPEWMGGQMGQMGQMTPLPWNEWNQWPDWEG